ncbi:Uncharacterized protein conserved in bacteria [Burkholderia pseudomallei]|nr:Uncharacterized protein conserved in bacteria [Burkholderia pseudomallei]
MSLPRAQRRLVELQHAQPVVQVVAKAAFAHRRVEIDVRRGDDPHVDRNRLVPAEPFDLAFLQEAQHARLAFERHVADFVEKQRAAVRRFDTADLALARARECAALVAEQFGLQQMIRNRAAVDRDERRLAALGALVDRERGQLLAGARFAGDEHGRVGRGDLADRPEQLLHRVARAHHLVARRGGARRDVEIAQRDHPVGMADEIINRLVRGQALHVVEAVLANQPAHVGIVDARVTRERDPADLLLAQHRFERRQLARREAVEIGDAGLRLIRLHAPRRFVRGARDVHVPASCAQVRDERRVGRARQVDELARGRIGR